ncbi:MAG: hypothetical protein K9H49_19240 [Bacteroidales bacterium]|nr:hypothetical protein [Bacteroidales bacterium]MCF8391783.1 hypothetical protein [Bacteroidales bacterium]
MMIRKDKKKIIVINAFLVAALFGLVSLNKEFLRPALNHTNLLKDITGCFPNFIAAFIISLAPVTAVIIRKPERGRLIVYLFSMTVFIILMIEELNPMWGASEYYDLYDIIASGLGSLLAIGCFEILRFFIKKVRKA